MDDDYLCVTVMSEAGESQSEFAARLSEFWTRMLREFADDFEKVYAETIAFEEEAGRFQRQYLCEDACIEVIVREMDADGIAHEEVDPDDRWSKYEAPASEWWQIEH